MRTAPLSAAHFALMTDFAEVLARYQSMPVIERIAVLASLVGSEILDCPKAEYSSAEILQVVALNIAGGNQGAALALADAAGPAGGGGVGHA